MRNANLITLIAVSLCALLIAGIGFAQTASPDKKEPEPVKYTAVSAESIQQSPDDFVGAYVQLPDSFGGVVERSAFPKERSLRSLGITSSSHYAFYTHKVSGSNMICFLARENEDAKEFFSGPLVPLSPIYIMGRIGKRIVTDEGLASICVVDRVVRGQQPPPPKTVKRKSITFKVEYDVQTPQGFVRREHRIYKIPKSGTSYEIIDPYTGKKLYMTFTF